CSAAGVMFNSICVPTSLIRLMKLSHNSLTQGADSPDNAVGMTPTMPQLIPAMPYIPSAFVCMWFFGKAWYLTFQPFLLRIHFPQGSVDEARMLTDLNVNNRQLRKLAQAIVM
uniref:hypothetical protein n=1 Tax=Massilia sp. TSP1-1-2 TaxID=2804649 RepID=UPI003CE86551